MFKRAFDQLKKNKKIENGAEHKLYVNLYWPTVHVNVMHISMNNYFD